MEMIGFYNAITGQIVAGENRQETQLNDSQHVIIDQETNSLIINDYGNRQVMRCSHQKKTNEEMIILDIDSYR